jgi:hypothetical protein
MPAAAPGRRTWHALLPVRRVCTPRLRTARHAPLVHTAFANRARTDLRR